MATLDVLIDGRAPPAFKRTLDAVVAEEVKGCTLPLHKPGALNDRIRYGTCNPTEVSNRLGKGIRVIALDITRDPASECGAEVDGYAGVPEVDRCPLGALFNASHRKLPLHLVCHHLNTGAPDRWYDASHRADKDHLIGERELSEFRGEIID